MKTSNFYYLFLLFGLFSCANVVSPEGGAKDTTPPQVLESSPPNYSLNFKKEKIFIGFDEYVTVQNPTAQIIISPPLEEFPEFRVRGKNVIISLKDQLDSNTTYTINFGESIVDYNESNVLKNFQYVFSTGNYLDSLFITGKVMDAFEHIPSENMLVMLYNQTADSVVYKQKPYYFTRTEKDGSFRISNIKYGTYKIFALDDQNFNFIYDLPNEKIAFHNTDLVMQDSMESINLNMFQEDEKSLQLYDVDDTKEGSIRFVYSRPVKHFDIQLIEPEENYPTSLVEFNSIRDTMLFWYDYNLYEEQTLLAIADTLTDTVKVTPPLLTKDSVESVPRLSFSGGAKQLSALELSKPLLLVFNRPVIEYHTEKIVLSEDTTKKVVQPTVEFVGNSKRKLQISYPWKPDYFYELLIPDSTFYDYYGMTNDSVVWNYKSKSEEDYAALSITFTGGNSTDIIQLISGNNKIIREINMGKQNHMSFKLLAPGDYKLKIIKDKNANGKWDTGNYLQKIQPEETYVYPDKINLRANWEMDVDVDITY